MRLVGAGDSWCWGAELVDPAIDPEPIMNLPGVDLKDKVYQRT